MDARCLYLHYIYIYVYTLKRNCSDVDYFVVTGGTFVVLVLVKRIESHVDYFVIISRIWGGHRDQHKYNRWLQSNQRDCLSVSV